MACIEKIYSVSALLGSNVCNGNCAFCAAKELKKVAPTDNKMPSTFKSALRLSARYGGWSLSLTSSGEPTCSPLAVTNALKDYQECAKEGAYFPNVNLFTNGILMGNEAFCDKYLPLWKELGLTAIAVSIHEIDERDQEKVYRVKNYPKYSEIYKNIRKHGLQCRATVLLRKGGIDTPETYKASIEKLKKCGCENISSWPIGNPDSTRNESTPSRWNLFRIRLWLKNNALLCHGHVWGGGVYDYHGTLVRITDYVTKHNPKKDFVRQLVVFQDGTVAYSWIKEGAICFKA